MATDGSYDLGPAAAPPPPPRKSREIRTTDYQCVKCGFNLRGLPKDRRCPECGSVQKQTQDFNDELQYGSPLWAGRLANGMTIFLIGALMFPVQLTIAIAFDFPPAVKLIFGAAEAIIEFIGLWYFTTPEPSPLQREQRWSLRRILRGCAVATVAGDLGMRGLFLLSLVAASWVPFLWSVNGILLIARVCVLGFYLHFLAKRVPDDQLANRALFVSWGLVFTSPTLVFALATGAYILEGGANVHKGGIVCVAVTGGPFILMYLMGLWLLGGFMRDLRASAKEARKAMIVVPGTGRGDA